MSKHDSIMIRMKENYESRAKNKLVRRMPVILRVDGKAFHTYCRGLSKPFDLHLVEDMRSTMQFLCQSIQGAKLGYCQSDEISILLTDYDTHETQAWFDYEQSKMESISASLATSQFNKLRLLTFIQQNSVMVGTTPENVREYFDLVDYDAVEKFTMANFDSRAFNIPREEVANYFLARQNDAVRNSIQMVARSLYSHYECDEKSKSDLQEMIFLKGQNWNDYPDHLKRGSICIKVEREDNRPTWTVEAAPMKFNEEFLSKIKGI